MRDDPGKLFEMLDPPSGGLERLRTRIESEPARRLQLATAFLLLLATLGLATQLPYGERYAHLPELDHARMRLGLGAQPSEPLVIPEEERGLTAVRRVSRPTDKVLFYLVGSLDQPEIKKQEL
jgi:hypothetical protein